MSVVSGILSSNAQNSATKSASNSQAAALAEQGREFDVAQQNYAPYKAIGEAAAPQYTNFVNGKTDITQDPLYQNALEAANRQATQQTAGAGQSTRSGAYQTRMAQLSDSIYNNAYQTKYQQLTDALKVGQGAAGSITNAGNQYANAVQQNANAMSSIYQNQANAQSSLYGGMSGQGFSALYNIGKSNNWWSSAASDAGSSAASEYAGSSIPSWSSTASDMTSSWWGAL